MMTPDEYGCDGDYPRCPRNVHALVFAAGKSVVVRVYHGGTRQQNATEWGVMGKFSAFFTGVE